MNFSKGHLIVVVGLISLSLGLSGCSNIKNQSQNNQQTTKTVSIKKANHQRYRQALQDLKHGADRQAYQKMTQVIKTGQATTQQRQLKKQIGLLLRSKKALAAAQLTVAEKNLSQLNKVKEPAVVVSQIKSLNKELSAAKLAQVYYQEVVAYYNAGKYDAAGGSYQALQALSRKYQAVATIQDQGAKYGQLISQKQSVTTASSSSATNSGYTNARNSKIANSEYQQKTGSSLAKATNSQVSSVVESLTDAQILTKFQQVSQIPQEAGDQYYVKQIDSQNYQIEIRHTSPSNSAVSNLKGMYQFNIKTNVISKLNEITGEYTRIN